MWKWIIIVTIVGGIFAYSQLDITKQDEIKEQIGGVMESIVEKANETIKEFQEEKEFEEENPSLNKIGKPFTIITSETTEYFDCEENSDCDILDECNQDCICNLGWCWK